MLLYGLRIRGIGAEAVETRARRGDRWAIVVEPLDAERARAAIGSVWDALFETEAAKGPDGRCGFCGYDMRGVPADADGRLWCPECGVDLRSLAARRAFRDGGRAPRA